MLLFLSRLLALFGTSHVSSFTTIHSQLKPYRRHKIHNSQKVNLPKRRKRTSSFLLLLQNNNKNFAKIHNEEEQKVELLFDETDAQSQFGTKTYWDDMYSGMGDFPSEEYSWYYGWSELKNYFMEYAPPPPPPHKKKNKEKETVGSLSNPKVLVPGIGNDSILLDLYNYGYNDITAFDYSQSAIERQSELLSYHNQAMDDIILQVRDARKLDVDWTNNFDFIFEKGALDAIYLSGEGYVDLAVEELSRVIKDDGGIFMSVSGVVPEELRQRLFPSDTWEWIRDGSTDLKAGCFIWKKR